MESLKDVILVCPLIAQKLEIIDVNAYLSFIHSLKYMNLGCTVHVPLFVPIPPHPLHPVYVLTLATTKLFF